MKFNSKRFSKQFVDKRAKAFTEFREGIIWEVLEESKICHVRIQGTNTNVVARFPQNLSKIPKWLRKGNSVQIAHRSGVRGYIKIMGQGATIPTAMADFDLPEPGALLDAVLTGCKITAADPVQMAVSISSGTFRLNDVEYGLSVTDNPMFYDDPPTMLYDDSSIPVMYYDGAMTKYLNTTPSTGYFRYDAFVVGEDSRIDYIVGATSTVPVKPDIPIDHLLIDDYILVIGGVGVIHDIKIGMQWSTPVISSITIDIAGAGIDYTLPYNNHGTPGDTADDPQYVEANIVFRVLNQFMQPMSGSYTLKIDKMVGDGDLWSSNSGYNDTSVSQYINGSSYTFKYRREQLVDNEMVVFTAHVTSSIKYALVGMITLGANI